MEQKMIEIAMSDNSKLYIETSTFIPSDSEDTLFVPAATENSVVKKMEEFLKKSFSQIKKFSDCIAEEIKSSAVCPEEFELEFGVKFAADAGIVISSLSSEANITIRMKWVK